MFRLTAQAVLIRVAHIHNSSRASACRPMATAPARTAKTVLEADPTTDPPVDVNGSLPLDLIGIGTRQLC